MRRGLLIGVACVAAGGCADTRQPPTGGPPVVNVHPAGWTDESAPAFHGAVLRASGFDLDECRTCHGGDWSGGVVAVSCRTCHTADEGPESCNTCHGDFAADAADLASAAPPAAVNGSASATARPVGAHQAHLALAGRTVEETCRGCHVVPESWDDPGHLDGDGVAEVVLGEGLATVVTEGGARAPAPEFSRADGTCASTYCHGDWGLLKSMSSEAWNYSGEKIEGSAAAPSWSDPASGACGTCHDLPPAGHEPADLDDCALCHKWVVDDAGAIVDPARHANGRVNVFEEEEDRDDSYPMF